MRNLKYIFIGILGIIIGATALTVSAQVRVFTTSQGGTGTSTAPTYGQMLVGNAGGTYTLTATSSLGISAFPFTPTSYGNATSTTLGFLNGFISTASTTFSSLGSGSLGINNGLVYNAATSTLSTITGTLSIAKGGTGVTSITGDRLWYSNADGSALLEIATSSLSIGGNAGTATALFANGANCSAGNYPLGVNASGAVEDCTAASTGTVTSIATTYPITGGTITTTGTLGIAFGTTTVNTWAETQTFTKAIVINEGTTATSTFAGNVKVTGNLQVDGQFFAPVTLVTSGNVNIAGNLGVTGTVDFALASSTQFSAATETFYINSVGRVQAKDTTNAWSGVVSPTRSFVLFTATTTSWQGTTTGAYVSSLSMPFAGTLRQTRCNATTTGAFLNIAPYIGVTRPTPNSFVASATPGIISFTAGNTFNAGDAISMYVGTSTVSTANKSVSCTFDVTETY